MEKVLLLGGTSFLSRMIAIRIIAEGYVVDILTRGKRTLDYTGFNEHIICDRRNEKEAYDNLNGREYDYILDINGYYPRDIKSILAIVDTGFIKKYIFCSSGSVYTFENQPVKVGSPRVADDWQEEFGLTKRRAEDALIDSGVPYIIIRPTFIYGERDEIPREGFLFDAVEKGRTIYMLQGSNPSLDFIYVDEAAEIFVSAVKSQYINRCYIASRSEAVTAMQYIKYVEEISGKKADIVWTDDKEKLNFPYGYETSLMCNEGLNEDGMYVPEVNLKDGLAKYYKWLRCSDIMM